MFQNKVNHIFFICQRFKNMFRIRGWRLIPGEARNLVAREASHEAREASVIPSLL